MTENYELLFEYSRNRSEPAFRELVARYFDLVYSTALRRVGGDAHLAEDVAQTVFLHLARKAQKLPKEVMLGGWLHEATCNVARSIVRSDRRRLAREKEAVQMNTLENDSEKLSAEVAPVLDEALGRLPRKDRYAILLRFFERQDFRSVGRALGSSEDAARVRVNRALEKLGTLLKRRGIRASGTALLAVLSTGVVTAAPNGLAMGVVATVLADVATATAGPVFGLVNLLTATNGKAAFSCALVVVCAGLIVWQHRESERLRAKNAQLNQQLSETQKRTEAVPEIPQLNSTELRELLRLRGEITLLHREGIEQTNSSLKPSYAVQKAIIGKPLPRESLADLGTATPEAAAETFFWGLLGQDKVGSYGVGFPPGLGSIAQDGDLENASTFHQNIGPLLLGDVDRIVSVELESATVSPYNTRDVPFALARDDGTSSRGRVTLTEGLGGWAVMVHGRGRGAKVELSFSLLVEQTASQ
jgi:RNA polymerase sigma factor (sigma-70 family)